METPYIKSKNLNPKKDYFENYINSLDDVKVFIQSNLQSLDNLITWLIGFSFAIMTLAVATFKDLTNAKLGYHLTLPHYKYCVCFLIVTVIWGIVFRFLNFWFQKLLHKEFHLIKYHVLSIKNMEI